MNSLDLEDLYRDLRPFGFAIAYRMLGSVSEAEDVVQEAFIRLSHSTDEKINNPKAYLATVTTRLAIDVLRSARMQRETYVGPWLPEPLVKDYATDVAEVAETAESLTMAFLIMLEQLSPIERAVFLMREVFAYEYDEIARIVGKSQANCRQLARRARQRIENGKPRFEASGEEQATLAQRFFAACQDGDVDGLVTLLASNAAFYGDGGDKGTGVPYPVYGRDNVVTLLLGLFRVSRRLDVQLQAVEVNGQPGAKCLDSAGGLISVLSLDIADGAIHVVRSIVNPEKLRHLGALSPIGRRAQKPS
ncbi:MAG: RNA polymerase sigma-70 factor [Pseudonocardiaceae bacterium]